MVYFGADAAELFLFLEWFGCRTFVSNSWHVLGGFRLIPSLGGQAHHATDLDTSSTSACRLARGHEDVALMSILTPFAARISR